MKRKRIDQIVVVLGVFAFCILLLTTFLARKWPWWGGKPPVLRVEVFDIIAHADFTIRTYRIWCPDGSHEQFADIEPLGIPNEYMWDDGPNHQQRFHFNETNMRARTVYPPHRAMTDDMFASFRQIELAVSSATNLATLRPTDLRVGAPDRSLPQHIISVELPDVTYTAKITRAVGTGSSVGE